MRVTSLLSLVALPLLVSATAIPVDDAAIAVRDGTDGCSAGSPGSPGTPGDSGSSGSPGTPGKTSSVLPLSPSSQRQVSPR